MYESAWDDGESTDTLMMRIQRNLFELADTEDFETVFRICNKVAADTKLIAAHRLTVIGQNAIGSTFDHNKLRDAFVQGMGGL